jgi:hypothetical protein
MKRQLGGAADDGQRFGGIGHAGQLDDDPPIAGADEIRLADAERVDPAAHHFQRLISGLRVRFGEFAVSGLQDYLGTAAQIHAQPWRPGGDKPTGHREYDKGEDRAHSRRARHGVLLDIRKWTDRLTTG